jgi:branched-chain amino acid transport system ATP-binding protein
MNKKQALLEVKDLTVSYGGINAVKGISFVVHKGDIVTLIGANGAGKTSTLHAVSGITPYKGGIFFKGQDLRKVPAHSIVGLGISQVPEGRGIFGNLTVMENLTISTWQRKDRNKIKEDLEYVFDLFPRLKERIKQSGGTLSGGEQQMLALGRALMSKGELLLLDEPSMGLSPLLSQEIFRMLMRINRAGTTLLLVEQNANLALKIAVNGYVLETGTITLSGTAEELCGNPLIKDAYLGG